MKEIKINDEYEVFDLFKGGYMFAPNQIVVITLANIITKKTIDVLGVIDSLSFDERQGSPTPLATISFFNLWKDGSVSGSMEMKIVPHRYIHRDPTIEEVNFFKDFDYSNELFYRKGDVLIYPFVDKDVE